MADHLGSYLDELVFERPCVLHTLGSPGSDGRNWLEWSP